MPANRPPTLGGAGTEPDEQLKPGKRPRIGRNGVLIAFLALAVVVGIVLIAMAPDDNKQATGAAATPSAGAAPGPTASVATSSIAPAASASVSASVSPSPSASPSASPSKTQPNTAGGGPLAGGNRTGCGASPRSCGFPDSASTGVPAGTKLTVVNSNLKITKAGTVIDKKDIRGCVEVNAPRVTIKRSKITCPNFYGVASFTERYSGGGLLIEDTDISCGNAGGTGIGSYGLTALRVDISGCENGFDIDNTVTVRDSYIHDPYSTAENHADGIQLSIGGTITISHNTIFMPDSTSAIISDPTHNSNVLVSNNLMSGGAYTLYCPRDHSSAYRVLNNRISTVDGPKGGEYGPWTDCEKVQQVSGNVWDNDLKPLSFN